MMRETTPGFAFHAEDWRRKATNSARDAVAIKIERGAIRRDHGPSKIHLHAVDDGEEILPLDREACEMRRERLRSWPGFATVERVDLLAPGVHLGLRIARRIGALPVAIGDIVHGTAEVVDRVHRLAFFTRENPHAGVKRRARCAMRQRRLSVGVKTHAAFRIKGWRTSLAIAASAAVIANDIFEACTVSDSGSRFRRPVFSRSARLWIAATSQASRTS